MSKKKEEEERIKKKKESLFLAFTNFEDLYMLCSLVCYLKTTNNFDILSLFKKLKPNAIPYEIDLYESIALFIENIYQCRIPNKKKDGSPNFNNMGYEPKDMIPKISELISNILPF